MKNSLPLCMTALCFFTFAVTGCRLSDSQFSKSYLEQIQQDFLVHRNNVADVDSINRSIVLRIDSLFDGMRGDTTNADLVKGIMNTRSYNKTILAYAHILDNEMVDDPMLRLHIARHAAYFEGFAEAKRHWDHQWDVTARPYLYANGLSSRNSGMGSSLYRNATFRSLLWDRRMFANDVLIWSPRILASADSVLARIDAALKK